MRQLKRCSNQIDFLNICQFSFQIVLKIKQGYNKNVNKLMNFFFRNRIIFWTFQNKIEDKQTETEGVNFYKEIKFTLLEEISWRQKSRVLQLREGDSNTRFFHKMANSNRRNNGIKNLRVNGSLSSNKNLIVNCITQFFMDLYSEQQVD